MFRRLALVCALIFTACGQPASHVDMSLSNGTPAVSAHSPALTAPLAWHLELTRQASEARTAWWYGVAQNAARQAVRPPAVPKARSAQVPARSSGGACGGWGDLVASLWPPSQVGTACRILMCESGGNPRAYNPSGAIGLFQLLGHGGTSDPVQNATVAHRLWLSSGWSPWVCR